MKKTLVFVFPTRVRVNLAGRACLTGHPIAEERLIDGRYCR